MSSVCSWPGCQRSFKNSERLKQHERQHERGAQHVCRICAKRYTRSDVLTRHLVQIHGEIAGPVGRPRRSSHTHQATIVPASDLGLLPKLTNAPYGEDSSSKRLSMEFVESPRSAMYLSDRSDQSTTRGPNFGPQAQPEANNNVEVSPDWLKQLLFPAMPVNKDGESSRQTPLFTANTFFADPLNWGLEDPYSDPMELLGSYPSLALATTGVTVPQPVTVPEREAALVVAVSPDDGPDPLLPEGDASDSAWPHVYKPIGPDSHINIPEPRSGSATYVADILFSAESVPEAHRRTMMTLVDHAHAGVWPLPDISNFPSRQILTRCANLYLGHFAEWLPVFDRDQIQLASTPPLLLEAMAAIGSTYGQDGVERLGIPLNELVRREVLFIREHDRRFMFEVNVIYASLLQSYFGAFCGSPKLFQQAEISRGSLVTASRRMHLLCPVPTDRPVGSWTDPIATDERKRRRLGWGIYLLDLHLACLMGLPAQFSLAEIQAPLPCILPIGSNLSFDKILQDLLATGRLPTGIDALGLSIIAYSLYRLCLDAASFASLIPWASRRCTSYQYTIEFTSHLKHHPQRLLDQLAIFSLECSLPPSPLLISCAALAYHSHLHFTWPEFLTEAHAAAGKFGLVRKTEAQRSISEWTSGNPAGARNIFGSAAMLYSLLRKFHFDTPSEVVWYFDSAIAMWSILKFGNQGLWYGSSMAAMILSWTPSARYDFWLQEGGPVSIQGLGESPSMTPEGILASTVESLAGMSWGLATRYKEVLQSVIRDQFGR